VGSVLLELRVAEQRFNTVMEVIRDGLTVIEVAERYGLRRDRTHHRSPLTIETMQGSGLVVSGSPSGPVGSHTDNAARYLLQGDDAMTGRTGDLLLGRDRCPPTPHQHRQGGAPTPRAWPGLDRIRRPSQQLKPAHELANLD
jgi:hypothetical protein